MDSKYIRHEHTKKMEFVLEYKTIVVGVMQIQKNYEFIIQD
jgi:hypothetical protein